MQIPRCRVIDFETEGIQRRPAYPPVPVGFSIKNPGERKSKYWSWGHPTANNCTKEQAQRVLLDAWRSGDPLLFQQAKFDVDVAQEHMGMTSIGWDRIHDTMYLLALHDPYAPSLSLKPSAERILGMPSTERNELRDWIVANVPEARRRPSEWGAYICKAPGDLVGRYADGDVVRTDKLFNKLFTDIQQRSMLEAYDRERRLMPILLDNERQGICVDLPKLERDYKTYTAALEKADVWLRKRLRTPNLNLDADQDVADALERNKIVTDWVYTAPSKAHPGGVRSVAKKNLTVDMFRDKKVAQAWLYRNIVATCIRMFMEPWLAMARESGGRIYTNWNQVRQAHGEDNTAGARTLRMSSNPNFQNVPKNWKKAIAEGYCYPAWLCVPELPFMRSYFLPDKGMLWGRRDYNQQELRFLAHFEDGPLMQRYVDNPRLDIHAEVQAYILEILGIDLPRDPVKILNFGDIYGRGLAALAQAMHVSVDDARRLRKAKDQLLPGVPALTEAIRQRSKAGYPIRTWGGREYYVEEPKFVKKYKRVMTFEYKLLNYLVQGSSADATKESIIRYHMHPKSAPNTGDGRFLVTVHDENDICAYKGIFKREMLLLRDVMQSIEADVPMLSDGEGGPNWAALQALKEPEAAFRTMVAHA